MSRTYTLLDENGTPYLSTVAGAVGGHRRGRIYGRLDCRAALRAVARGGYVAQRVFFADEVTARAAGYRPCAVCLPERYRLWQEGELGSSPPLSVPSQPPARSPTPPPLPITDAEAAAVLRLLRRLRPRPEAIIVGCSRDPISLANAAALAAAWPGTVLDVVDWPEQAASWLRQARRFTADEPDAWVVTGKLPGWARLGRRLTRSTGWSPSRTVATACLAEDELIAAGGVGTFDGLRGAHRDGGTWEVAGTLLFRNEPHGEEDP